MEICLSGSLKRHLTLSIHQKQRYSPLELQSLVSRRSAVADALDLNLTLKQSCCFAEKYMKDAWKMHGGCMKDAWRMHEGCMEDA